MKEIDINRLILGDEDVRRAGFIAAVLNNLCTYAWRRGRVREQCPVIITASGETKWRVIETKGEIPYPTNHQDTQEVLDAFRQVLFTTMQFQPQKVLRQDNEERQFFPHGVEAVVKLQKTKVKAGEEEEEVGAWLVVRIFLRDE